MPKLSIIIPVYNVEKYIRECLDSVINQNFTDFEVLLINDGSPDNSGVICDEYAEIDSRVRVIHQKNKGLSGARNTGLKLAKGEWITFIDPDDYLTTNTAYSEIFSHNLDVIDMIRFGYLKGDSMENASINLPKDHNLLNGVKTVENFSTIFKQLGFRGGAWNCIFRKDIIEGLEFESIMPKEDIMFLQTALLGMKNILVINEPYYFYRNSPNSITTKFNPKAFPMACYYVQEISKKYKQSEFCDIDTLNEVILHHFVDCTMNAMKSDDEKMIVNLLKEYAPKFGISQILTFKRILQDKPIYITYLLLKFRLYKLLVKGFKKKHS